MTHRAGAAHRILGVALAGAALWGAAPAGAASVTEIPIPRDSAAPRAIVAGKDDAMWYVDNGFRGAAPVIGRIDVQTGEIRELPTSGNGSQIVAAADGRL